MKKRYVAVALLLTAFAGACLLSAWAGVVSYEKQADGTVKKVEVLSQEDRLVRVGQKKEEITLRQNRIADLQKEILDLQAEIDALEQAK